MSGIVKYHLKQETPMWHFQCRDSGSQKGATLRGSDIKPRFDKFLIRQMEVAKIDWSKYKLTSDHDALDYKLQIVAKGNTSEKELGHNAFLPIWVRM